MRTGRLCDWCLTNEADPRYQEVLGFVRARDAGGANTIYAKKDTGRRICTECLAAIRGGDVTVRPQELPFLIDAAS